MSATFMKFRFEPYDAGYLVVNPNLSMHRRYIGTAFRVPDGWRACTTRSRTSFLARPDQETPCSFPTRIEAARALEDHRTATEDNIYWKELG